MANNGNAKIISNRETVVGLAIIPNPVCVGVVASHILAGDGRRRSDPLASTTDPSGFDLR